MSKAFTPTIAKPGVITANNLREGHNVWMCEDGWTADPAQATIFEDEAIADLALLKAIGQADIVVGPYLVEARRGPNGPEPAHFREAFRQRGPSNYFHGIQAEKGQPDPVQPDAVQAGKRAANENAALKTLEASHV